MMRPAVPAPMPMALVQAASAFLIIVATSVVKPFSGRTVACQKIAGSSGRKRLICRSMPAAPVTTVAEVVPKVPADSLRRAMASAIAAASPPSTTAQIVWAGMPLTSGALPFGPEPSFS